ncbi:hypothetical protein [Bradyrhizobium arachidis]|uniref:hypothetical protein n=1 Tax=Bradyrhizobium arachidis TaxID=858423 RepID=UPI0021638E37|nr:hypothetical protein [Bradyrhizobium arachidis]UVO30211.1 hypothetical protein KUF59_05465 [Bradyrhizobium arachidis]
MYDRPFLKMRRELAWIPAIQARLRLFPTLSQLRIITANLGMPTTASIISSKPTFGTHHSFSLPHPLTIVETDLRRAS